MTISSDSIARCIKEATEAFESHEPVLWSLPIVRALEAKASRHALEWTIKFYEEQLVSFRGEQSELEANWLRDLRSFKNDELPSFNELITRSRQIWDYRKPPDLYQKGIADLYAATAAMARNDQLGYEKYVAWALNKFCLDSLTERRDMFRLIINSLEKYTSPAPDSP